MGKKTRDLTGEEEGESTGMNGTQESEEDPTKGADSPMRDLKEQKQAGAEESKGDMNGTQHDRPR